MAATAGASWRRSFAAAPFLYVFEVWFWLLLLLLAQMTTGSRLSGPQQVPSAHCDGKTAAVMWECGMFSSHRALHTGTLSVSCTLPKHEAVGAEQHICCKRPGVWEPDGGVICG